MSVASCQQIKKPGCEVKRNRANRKEIHQMNVSINGETGWKGFAADRPSLPEIPRAHPFMVHGYSADSSMPELTKGYYSLSFAFA